MTDNSKKVSQLPIAATASGTDRVVILSNPSGNAILKTVTVANLTSNLPYANSTLGGVVKIGNNITIDTNGTISAGSGVPDTNAASVGYVLTTNSSGNVAWQKFGGVYNVVTVDSVNHYTVTPNDGVILVNPAVVGADVTITFPIATAIEGKEVLVKLIDASTNHKVIINTDDFGDAYLEDPITGAFDFSYNLVDTGQAETWIHDGNVYRHLNTARATPIFYTNANTYAQVVVKNQNSGNNASSDIALYNNLGNYEDGTGPYIDIGIDGSNYSNSLYTAYGPNDGYVYVDNNGQAGGNLILGTAGDRSIVMHVGGTQLSNRVFSVNSSYISTSKSIIPTSNNIYSLGNSSLRFQSLWVGGNSVIFADQNPEYPDQTLTVGNGVFYITLGSGNTSTQSNAGLRVGNYYIHDSTLELTNASATFYIGSNTSSGNLVINRPIVVYASNVGANPTFNVDRNGHVQIHTPTTILTTDAAFGIIGANSGVSIPRNFTGTLIQATAQDGQPARVGFDAFGANTYVSIAGRGARGSVIAPSGTQSNDTIIRMSMQGWVADSNTYAGSIGRINMMAAENFYAANTGTKVTFQLTPVGSNTIQSETIAFTANGINFTNNPYGTIKFNDGTIQNTAFTNTAAVTRINAGVGLVQSGNVGIVGLDSTAVLSVSGTANQVSVSNVGGNYTLSLPQNIATTSNVQFNTVTVTNLTVTGASTIANSASVANAVLNLAYNSANAAQIDTGGITLGNTTSAYYVSIKYNLSNNAWTTGNTNFITKNLTATANITANVGYFTGQVHAGAAYIGYDYPNATIQADCNNNAYNQVVIQNHSSGTQGSSDFVATNDIGNDSANYLDLGINSSTYANNDYSMGGPNDAYLYVNGGSLDIATQTAGKDIQFYTGNTTTDALRATVNTSGLAVVGNVSATYLIGNALTANTTSFVGTVSAANVVSNAQLVANLTGYQTSAGLSANVAKLTANLATYIVANSGLVSNSSGVFVNSAYITALVADDDSGYQTNAGLAANVATLSSNNTNYVGTVAAANVVSNAQLVANLANYQLITNMAYYQTTGGLAANVATLTANNANTVNYVGTVAAANVVSNAQLQSNLSAYVLSSALSASLAGYQTISALPATVTTLTANNTLYVGSVTAANVVSNAQLVANLANYTNTSGVTTLFNNLAANITSNNTNFVGTVAAANVVSNAQLLANLSNYTTTTALNANLANYVNTTANYTLAGNIVFNNTVSLNHVTANGVAGANGQVLVANTSDGVYWSDLKTYKVKKVKHKDGSYDPEVYATVLQDSMTFVDGTGIVMVSNSINQTIQINAQQNIRDAGAVNSLVIDFAVDEIILIQPTNSSTFTMNNYSVGKKVEVWIAPTTTKAITMSGVTTSHATLACTAPVPVSGQMIKMEYLSTTTANTGVYVNVNR